MIGDNMRYLSKQNVCYVYEKLKRQAGIYLDGNDLERAIHLIETAAQWGYHYTYRYADDELEEYLQRIAKEVKISLHEVSAPHGSKDERIVFVCNRMVDNWEVTQQYSRALAASGIPTLIIVINRDSKEGNENIRSELRQAENITVKWVEDSQDYIEVVVEIASLIYNYQPTKILAHVWPWDTRPIVAIMAAKKCPCYNINFNDHSFWIGKSMLDYLIEFRPYGSTISIEKRGLKPEQLIYLPYYPIISTNIPFQGFPFDRNGKVVIFTGGSAYKMLGKDNLYFDNLDAILGDNPNAVVLLACGTLGPINERISKMKNKAQVFTTTFRKDIASLFLNSDIYYATYPMSGGLMSQYAATLSRPIIAYVKEPCALDEIDGIVNYHNDLPISFYSCAELKAYASRLCKDKDYRIEEGKRLYDSMIKQAEFESVFIDMMHGKHSISDHKLLNIDYDSISQFYLDFHNTYSAGNLILLIKALKLNAFLYFPEYTRKYMMAIMDKIRQKISQHLISFRSQ